MTATAPAAVDALPVSAHPSQRGARRLGALVLGLAGTAVLLSAVRARRPGTRVVPRPARAALRLRDGAALLAVTVLADSSVEHYRGAFENPGMYAPPAAAGAVLLLGARAPAGTRAVRDGVHLIAFAVGAAGAGFHAYNVLRRLGGLRWTNLFYGAPLGAPAALALAGLLGLAADRVGTTDGARPELMGFPAGRALGGLIGAGLAGTVGEVALLHFRGAFHNPFMWVPVALPPAAAALLVKAALDGTPTAFARQWLVATALLGVAGVGFHIYGVGRHMGGWGNWRQNLLDGPPIPAPPSFTALSIAGLAALSLMERTDG